MSKALEARVRGELLQSLYAATLRCILHCTAAGIAAGDAAFAAGLAENLRDGDTVLLPARGGAGLRVLRGLPARPGTALGELQEVAAGVARLPSEERSAAHLALGAAIAAKTGGSGALVCVLLPAAKLVHAPLDRPASRNAAADTWTGAGAYAARHGLPLLLATLGPLPRAAEAAASHRRPAPAFPTVPVDGADALAIYRVAFECAQRARAGMGPSHIAGVPFRGRGLEEDADGLARLETMLRRHGVFSKAAKRQLERQILRELQG